MSSEPSAPGTCRFRQVWRKGKSEGFLFHERGVVRDTSFVLTVFKSFCDSDKEGSG